MAPTHSLATPIRISIEGNPGADNIAGKGAASSFYGNRDNDELHGGDGPDNINGGKHSDSDTLYGENGNDKIIAIDESARVGRITSTAALARTKPTLMGGPRPDPT